MSVDQTPSETHSVAQSKSGSSAKLAIPIACPCTSVPVDKARIRGVLTRIAAEHHVDRGEISVAVVDRETIQRLHKKFLHDDTPTDVLSFPMGGAGRSIEGEIVACGDVALEVAARLGWPAEAELLLYLVHGLLHLLGYDDHEPQAAEEMRAKQRGYLAELGWNVPDDIEIEPAVEASP